MWRFLLFSVMAHFAFAGFSELIFDVTPPTPPRDPVTVTLIKSVPLPNEEFPEGRIVESIPPDSEQTRDDSLKSELADFDSSPRGPQVSEELLHKEISVPKKKVVLPDKQAEVGLKNRPATTQKPVPVERPGLKADENLAFADSPNPFIEDVGQPEPSRSEPKKLEYQKELERIAPNPKLQAGLVIDAMRPEKEPQEGERLLTGEEADLFIANNPDTYLETKDEIWVSLNTQKFKYMAYFSRIRRAVETVWFYPEQAMIDGVGGQAQVRFTLSKEGVLVEQKIVSSSGADVLDIASVMAVKSAGPFPPFPEALDKKRIHIVATFSYRPVFSAIP